MQRSSMRKGSGTPRIRFKSRLSLGNELEEEGNFDTSNWVSRLPDHTLFQKDEVILKKGVAGACAEKNRHDGTAHFLLPRGLR